MSDHPHTPNTADTADLVADLRWLAAVKDFPVVTDAADEIERLSAIVAAVDALHVMEDDGFTVQWCAACGFLWPCPTHLALHPEDNR